MEFQSGQKWSYQTREGEENSRIVIIETDEDAIHIYIDKLKLTTPKGQKIPEVYVPISHSALEKSVINLESEESPNYSNLRDEWLENHDTRGQGYFTLELEKFLNSLENATNV